MATRLRGTAFASVRSCRIDQQILYAYLTLLFHREKGAESSKGNASDSRRLARHQRFDRFAMQGDLCSELFLAIVHEQFGNTRGYDGIPRWRLAWRGQAANVWIGLRHFCDALITRRNPVQQIDQVAVEVPAKLCCCKEVIVFEASTGKQFDGAGVTPDRPGKFLARDIRSPAVVRVVEHFVQPRRNIPVPGNGTLVKLSLGNLVQCLVPPLRE